MTSDAGSTMRRMTARVSGDVQGVGYRVYARRRAQGLGLRGYAQNLPDDAVLVVAEGPRDLLEQLLTLLRQGPITARVSDARAEWSDPMGEFSRFSVR
jgi:acylphosphatase